MANAMNPARRTKRHPSLTMTRNSIIEMKAGEKWKNDPDINIARQAHKRYIEAMDAIANMINAPDPLLTPTANRARLEAAGKKAIETASKSAERASSFLKKRIEALGDIADERLGLKSTNPQAAEIRSILRGMENKEKREVFRDAIASEDSDLIGAVLSATNPLLLGVDKAQMKRWRDEAESGLLPDLVQFRDAAEYTVDLLDDSFIQSVKLMDQVTGTPDEVSADQAAIDAARKAEAALSEALAD
ncbi:hypothetical protein [Thalassospira indica]|uniref:Uncharacterized protein n=1 Tax=Thalassospira indica TaxID=1891279 RepID=A0ABM6XUF6_9PROT|nr:hypothetical protein [Thalassospira indica]AXO13307.1 hypothetical protein DY252_02820 [Thalassospira indica]OAZ14821.1 hypothetical protein TH15_03215 [Thalassospira profundimaris]